jgi:hypothetical protein
MKATQTKKRPRRIKKGSKAPSSARKGGSQLASEYAKYFHAPLITPPSFHILDMSDGTNFTTSSHT